MARITNDEIKKILETERDMTAVIDASNKSAKKTCDTIEKQMLVMEKHMKAMERTLQVSEKNVEFMQRNMQAMEKNTEVMQQQMKVMEKNTEVLQRSIQSIENQLNIGKKRSERMRIPSESSDVMITSPTPSETPAAVEPLNKKTKCENPPVQNSVWKPVQISLKPNNNIPQSFHAVPPFIIPPMQIPPPVFPQNSQLQEQRRPQISLQVRRPSRFDRPAPVEIRCFFCGNANNTHDCEDCPVLQDHTARVRFMNLNFRCLTCSDPRYRCSDAKTCRFASRKCPHCPMKHWHALCPTKYPSTTPFSF